MLRETEQLHGSVRRYTSPTEHAFFPGERLGRRCSCCHATPACCSERVWHSVVLSSPCLWPAGPLLPAPLLPPLLPASRRGASLPKQSGKLTALKSCVHPLPPKDELPPLVLPPLGYPPVLAPCAEAINFNERIMGVYLNDILPGEGGAGWQLRSRAAGQARSQAAVRACSLPVMVTACFGSAPCPALALMVQSLKHLPLSPPSHHARRRRRQLRQRGDAGRAGAAGAVDAHPLRQVCGGGQVQVRAAEGGGVVCAGVVCAGATGGLCVLLRTRCRLAVSRSALEWCNVSAAGHAPWNPLSHLNRSPPQSLVSRARPEEYTPLIKARDAEGLMRLLTGAAGPRGRGAQGQRRNSRGAAVRQQAVATGSRGLGSCLQNLSCRKTALSKSGSC